ncbi:MAG: Asp-tRNA(Asn)/Glu-tRNA(Gln) amidotransferase subunit GatB [Alphaproteobacteria bacterium]|jgi:aspartyl-tRNA(Asn)/glutamyl-tRNA(Gln) amidotransferase subunit B|nr:Asp-tRNA(Asn)/Glu-tRNA(Gln) amidotransferase subunit GatB [Alphaproteobacteria bacterium]
MATYKTEKNEYEIVIGVEIHAQINTKSKLFSHSSTEFGAKPNSQVSFVDAAMPGMLPVLNKEAIKKAALTGFAIEAKVNEYSIFDRKNYFYADLPQGYQISQFSDPLVTGGKIKIKDEHDNNKIINITRIHVEQDAGKSIHDQSPTHSFVDLNRSGVPLMELVSEPELSSAFEAADFVKKYRNILRYINSCGGDMEKGQLRCDANISLRLVGCEELGTRCEIKNLNSTRNIMLAIDYEVARQAKLLDNGEQVRQQTRLFDVNTGETRMMRDKEDAHDYRYFPDPDLLPLRLSKEFLQEVKDSLPELPEQKKARYLAEEITEYDADVLISDKDVTNYFEELFGNCNTKLAVTWLTGELFARLKKDELNINESPVTAKMLLGLIKQIEENIISGKIAKDVLDKMILTGKDAKDIIAAEGLVQITDDSAIIAIITEVIANNADKVAEYKSGKDRLFGFFVGQVMKISKGKANPALVNKLLKEELA